MPQAHSTNATRLRIRSIKIGHGRSAKTVLLQNVILATTTQQTKNICIYICSPLIDVDMSWRGVKNNCKINRVQHIDEENIYSHAL